MIWFYDLFTMVALVLAYIVGFSVLVFVAGYVAPRVARRFAARFSLQASMILIGLLVIVSGFAGIGLLAYALASLAGFEVSAGIILGVIATIAVLNIFTYMLSPLLINLMYGARHDSELQKVVDEVASRLGFAKPPKAVVVNGPPNAFAYGNFISGRYVAVTKGMLEIATPEELRAVIGHELGHHKHRDNAIMLFMGLIPSVLYFLGLMLVRAGLIFGYARSYTPGDPDSSSRRGGGEGLVLLLVGLVAIVLSFVIQVLVLAFSRLREYYADTAGAYATSPRSMQRALARLHVYYYNAPRAMEHVASSKLRALFIYAFTEAYASPFYSYLPARDVRSVDIDNVVEQLKKQRTEDVLEFFSTHPPIPKRIRFLDTLAFDYIAK